ncbi:mycothione reductase [Lacisediminihabitans changchengi]|uniref:Mycothione reductase n=1 Tax=Lacisediminihabitans changchengi TaxID=2787634 RepID=A0A934SJB1_9MICO|nr:mycothione reductase [Lacisediminihabitans changchengi]MBK4347737.1 mycothione reductase [Lacisediminihabitans changchengi]
MPELAQAESLDFDLIIIGGGSGNSIIGRDLSHLTIALIDDGEHFGGTCLNAGCIPTKMFVHVADVAADALRSDGLGLRVPTAQVDWAAIRDRVFGRIDQLSEAGFRNRDQKIPNVTVFRERFHFVDQHELVGASGVRLRAPRIVIAAGSRPRPLPAAEGVRNPAIHDSDSIMRIEQLPASMVIVGGGAVAAEFAHVFSAYGVQVTQVVRAENALDRLDSDIAERFTELARARWRVVTGASVASIDEDLRITLDSGERFSTDLVLSAIGRIPNSDTLGLGDAGFDVHSDGRLVVDAEQRALAGGTPVDGIYGLGDVSSEWQLKHVANHEARVVKHNLLQPHDLIGGDPGPIPAAIFSSPQVAYFGLTEAEAPDAVVATRAYGTTAWGWALEDTTSFCKLVVDGETGMILGAHLIGPEASILIQVLVFAASHGIPVTGLARSMYWPHPAASEVVENALLDAEKLVVQKRHAEQINGGEKP